MAYWLVDLANADQKLKNSAGYTPEDIGLNKIIPRD